MNLTTAMQKPPYQHFGFGVFTLNAAHVVAAGSLGVHIGHGANINCRNQDLIQMIGWTGF